MIKLIIDYSALLPLIIHSGTILNKQRILLRKLMFTINRMLQISIVGLTLKLKTLTIGMMNFKGKV